MAGKEPPAGPGLLSPSTSVLLLLLYTLVYVLPLYASKNTRPSRFLSRDSPAAIRARVTSVTVSTALCSLLTFVILTRLSPNDDSSPPPLRAMGCWPLGLVDSAKSLGLVALLFLGPLYEALVVDGLWQDWLRLRPVWWVLTEWTYWRNIVVGPVTEEILFRSAAVPLLTSAGMSLGNIIFLTPLIFGVAHVHHFYEFRLTHPDVPLVTAVLRSVLQLTYTSLFGSYATFLFLRTDSLLAIITVHAFCNSMGLPRFWGPVQPYWLPRQQVDSAGAAWKWSLLYYVLLVVGFVGWWRNLWSWTESGNALVTWT